MNRVNRLAADEVEAAGGAESGTVKRGTIKGEVNAQETDQAFVKLTNVRKKEEAERKRRLIHSGDLLLILLNGQKKKKKLKRPRKKPRRRKRPNKRRETMLIARNPKPELRAP